MQTTYQIHAWAGSASMKSLLAMRLLITVLILLGVSRIGIGQENQKDAQTGFQFMSVTSDAKAAAMAEAMTTVEGSAIALNFNPAGIARLATNFEASFSVNQWIAGIQHNSAGLLLRPQGGKYGVLGLSLLSVDYGTLQGTMVWPNSLGYVDTEEFAPSAFSIGIAYGKALSDKFSLGVHLKNASSYLGHSTILKEDSTFATTKNVANALAFDFGTLFKTGIRDVTVGMSVKNFSKEVTYANGVENFQLPLLFTLGLSFDIFRFIEMETNQSLVFALDATHPRSHPEQYKFGLEYAPLSMLAIRTGYLMNNDEDDLTFGLGINYSGVTFDYAMTPFGRFDSIQRLSLRIAL
jgi:hypothetical protein